MQFKALLLDLDGTLIDTAADMLGTLNRVLSKHQHAAVDNAIASKLVSNGARALLEFGFAQSFENQQAQELIEEFLEDYANHVSDLSQPYSGMPDVLTLCEENNIRWGVVTNKPFNLSRALLDDLQLLERCSILLGGDSLPVKKPDPAPLLHCCMILNIAASDCLYVGDHLRDIQAGNAAGMDTAAALWGYLGDDQDASDWNANYLVQNPLGLKRLIQEKLKIKL